MQKLRFFSLLLIISTISSTFASIDFKRYQKEADYWIEQNILNDDDSLMISECDLQSMLNLIYFSYQRSLATLQASDACFAAVEAAWHGWQNVATKRLNPAHALAFDIDYTQQKALFDQSIKMQQEHRKACAHYEQAVNHIVDGAALNCAASPLAIDRLRMNARAIIAANILSMNTQINLFSGCIQELFKRNRKISRTLKENIMAFLPGFALSSFLKLENGYSIATAKTWKALEKLQHLSIEIYSSIELERAAYYGAHYNRLYKLMKKHQLSPSYFLISISEHGIIPAHQRTCALPKQLF